MTYVGATVPGLIFTSQDATAYTDASLKKYAKPRGPHNESDFLETFECLFSLTTSPHRLELNSGNVALDILDNNLNGNALTGFASLGEFSPDIVERALGWHAKIDEFNEDAFEDGYAQVSTLARQEAIRIASELATVLKKVTRKVDLLVSPRLNAGTSLIARNATKQIRLEVEFNRFGVIENIAVVNPDLSLEVLESSQFVNNLSEYAKKLVG